MRLYHISVDCIETLEIRTGNIFLDFALGFYKTTAYKQAERRAKIKMRRKTHLLVMFLFINLILMKQVSISNAIPSERYRMITIIYNFNTGYSTNISCIYTKETRNHNNENQKKHKNSSFSSHYLLINLYLQGHSTPLSR